MDFDGLKSAAEDLKGKAEELIGSTIKDEARTDAVLDSVADAAKKATGGKFDEKIDSARDAIDEKIGE